MQSLFRYYFLFYNTILPGKRSTSFQRLFSPANPSTNFLAAANLALQASASSYTAYFNSMASLSCLLRDLTFSTRTLTFSSTFSNSFFFVSAILVAASYDAFKGATFL